MTAWHRWCRATGALILAVAADLSDPVVAQQQSGYTITWSQGRSSVSSSRSQSAAAALNGVELVLPSTEFLESNVRRIVRPDGSIAFEIINPDKPFGSYAENRTREQEVGSGSRFFSTFSGIGYSVFQQ